MNLNVQQKAVLAAIKPGHPLVVTPRGCAFTAGPYPEKPQVVPIFRVIGLENRGLIDLAFDPSRHTDDQYVLTKAGAAVLRGDQLGGE
jgi:hypothetical protein